MNRPVDKMMHASWSLTDLNDVTLAAKVWCRQHVARYGAEDVMRVRQAILQTPHLLAPKGRITLATLHSHLRPLQRT